MPEDPTALQSMEMLELVYEDGGVTYRVQVREGMTLGRASDNDVVLRDFSVSRHHARVDERDGEFHLVDLESTNGIRINETPLASGTFSAGDLLGVGSFELHVESAADDSGGLSSVTYGILIPGDVGISGLQFANAISPRNPRSRRPERVFARPGLVQRGGGGAWGRGRPSRARGRPRSPPR